MTDINKGSQKDHGYSMGDDKVFFFRNAEPGSLI